MKKDSNISVPTHLVENFLNFLKTLSKSELKDLETGDSTIKFSVNSKHDKEKNIKTANESLKDHKLVKELEKLKDNLYNMNNREDGLFLLERHSPTRSRLEALAKLLDISVTKRDSVEHIRTKIVDTTIGFRLRSKAIRGK